VPDLRWAPPAVLIRGRAIDVAGRPKLPSWHPRPFQCGGGTGKVVRRGLRRGTVAGETIHA